MWLRSEWTVYESFFSAAPGSLRGWVLFCELIMLGHVSPPLQVRFHHRNWWGGVVLLYCCTNHIQGNSVMCRICMWLWVDKVRRFIQRHFRPRVSFAGWRCNFWRVVLGCSITSIHPCSILVLSTYTYSWFKGYDIQHGGGMGGDMWVRVTARAGRSR